MKWQNIITSSHLPNHMILQALYTRITKILWYPLPTTCFTLDICKKLDSSVYSFSLPKCEISSKIPLATRHSPLCYYGLALTSIFNQQGVTHTTEFIHHLNNNTLVRPQLQAGLQLSQLWIGHPKCIFQCDYSKFGTLLPTSWIGTTCEFLSSQHITIQGPFITNEYTSIHNRPYRSVCSWTRFSEK